MRPGLYAIVDVDTLARQKRDVIDFAARVLEAGPIAALQLRAKSLDAHELDALATALAARCRARAVPFFVNDHPAAAARAGADGVHVGTDDATVAEARALAPGLHVGRSSHHSLDVREGLDVGADYVAFGPVFGTRSKLDASPTTGIDALREAVALCDARGVPVVAIGGITLENAPLVRASGARAGAVISALATHDDAVTATARALHAALGGP